MLDSEYWLMLPRFFGTTSQLPKVTSAVVIKSMSTFRLSNYILVL